MKKETVKTRGNKSVEIEDAGDIAWGLDKPLVKQIAQLCRICITWAGEGIKTGADAQNTSD